MPRRLASSLASRQLDGYDSGDENGELEEVEQDDAVAATSDEDGHDEQDDVEVDLEEDEDIDEAEDWVFFEQSDSDSDDDTEEEIEDNQQYRSSDGTEWHTVAEAAGRRPQHNIVTERSGFRRGLRPVSEVEAFQVIFDNILDSVVTYTNITGRRIGVQKGIEWKRTNREEINAFIGLHILAGALKAHHRPLPELWDTTDGAPLFRAAMSLKRFEQIKAAARFDDPLRRNRNDRLSPVRNVVEIFNNTMRDIYKPSEHLTIDEQLIEFHGRVHFRQYIPTKPGKFGIKVYWLTEAESSFPLRCLVYIGQQTLTDEEKTLHGGHVTALVMKLMEPYVGIGRNLTGDNWFSNATTCNALLDVNTTYVGTLRSNSRCLPTDAKSVVQRTRGDSKHYYSGNETICSFWDKGRKTVNLISTMHGRQRNLAADEGKSEIVQFYNATKSGVDTLDKIVRGFSSKRKYRRWPMHIFFTLIDCGTYAAYQMVLKTNDRYEGSHYRFKKNLAYQLTLPLVERRLQVRGLRSSVKEAMAMVGVAEVQQPIQGLHPAHGRTGRCALCPRVADKKSKTSCQKCGKLICPVHQVVLCKSCYTIE